MRLFQRHILYKRIYIFDFETKLSFFTALEQDFKKNHYNSHFFYWSGTFTILSQILIWTAHTRHSPPSYTKNHSKSPLYGCAPSPPSVLFLDLQQCVLLKLLHLKLCHFAPYSSSHAFPLWYVDFDINRNFYPLPLYREIGKIRFRSPDDILLWDLWM